MNLLVVATELMVASVAIVLAFLSVFTMRALRLRGIQRTFWTPVFVSSYLFLVGSILALLHELPTKLTMETRIIEIMHHVTWLAGLCILTYGVYVYFGMIKKAGS